MAREQNSATRAVLKKAALFNYTEGGQQDMRDQIAFDTPRTRATLVG